MGLNVTRHLSGRSVLIWDRTQEGGRKKAVTISNGFSEPSVVACHLSRWTGSSFFEIRCLPLQLDVPLLPYVAPAGHLSARKRSKRNTTQPGL